MTKTALIPLADGVEEIEAVTLIDVLRRAGTEVTVAAIGDHREITGARGVRLLADALLTDVAGGSFDLIALPGGLKGSQALSGCAPLIELLRGQRHTGRLFAAVCAAPALVLAPHGLLDGRQACCYPGMEDRLPDAQLAELKVVVDGNCITSQGPATAMLFALALVEELFGQTRRQQIAADLLA